MSLNIFLIEAQTKYLWHRNVSCQIKCRSPGRILRSSQPPHQEISKYPRGVASRRGPAGSHTKPALHSAPPSLLLSPQLPEASLLQISSSSDPAVSAVPVYYNSRSCYPEQPPPQSPQQLSWEQGRAMDNVSTVVLPPGIPSRTNNLFGS